MCIRRQTDRHIRPFPRGNWCSCGRRERWKYRPKSSLKWLSPWRTGEIKKDVLLWRKKNCSRGWVTSGRTQPQIRFDCGNVLVSLSLSLSQVCLWFNAAELNEIRQRKYHHLSRMLPTESEIQVTGWLISDVTNWPTPWNRLPYKATRLMGKKSPGTVANKLKIRHRVHKILLSLPLPRQMSLVLPASGPEVRTILPGVLFGLSKI